MSDFEDFHEAKDVLMADFEPVIDDFFKQIQYVNHALLSDLKDASWIDELCWDRWAIESWIKISTALRDYYAAQYHDVEKWNHKLVAMEKLLQRLEERILEFQRKEMEEELLYIEESSYEQELAHVIAAILEPPWYSKNPG
ncbi:hypothetical protein MYX82_13620 [Acidobacteria bacterium AH-259-D05]|nr:hypothetical protein [Acidobacteria bacterium AH-259-D05]